jgi:hypothetical protein
MKKGSLTGFLLILILTSTLPAFADEGSKDVFYTQPAYLNNIDPALIYHELRPGDTIEDAVLTVNSTDEILALSFYGTDMFLQDDGIKYYKFPSDENNTINNWITFEQETYTFRPDETEVIPFRISIPEDINPDTYEGGIATEKAPAGTGSGINFAIRTIAPIKIIVTNNPREIERTPKFTSEKTISPSVYFWLTVGVFFICTIYVTADIIFRKKRKVKNRIKQ